MRRYWVVLLPLVLLVAGCAGPIRDVQPPDASATNTSPTLVAQLVVSPPSGTPLPALPSTETRAATMALTPTPTPAPSSTGLTATAAAQALPTPTIVHAVAEGETLLEIARRYGISVEALQRANQISDPNRLSLGQELVIPPAGEAAGTGPTPVGESTEPTAVPTPALLLACPANATARPVALDFDPIQILSSGDRAYLLAGGALFSLPLDSLAGSGELTPESAMPPQRRVGAYTIQELVYAATDPDTGDLLLLDKTNDIYRRTVSGAWRMEVPAGAIPGQVPDPQYLAVRPFAGHLYVLDADLGRIWRFAPGQARPVAHLLDSRLASGVDLAVYAGPDEQPQVFVLDHQGQVLRFADGRADTLLTKARGQGMPWPAQLAVADSHVLVADGEARRITLLDRPDGRPQTTVELRFPGMRRLRGALLVGDRLHVLAGQHLYSMSLAAGPGDCPPVAYDDGLYFAGRDVRALIPGARLPFPHASLPMRPRSYPGARRLYRYGVHEGVDLYPGDVAGLGYGSPVAAIAAGTVVRVDAAFVEMTAEEYAAAIARAEAAHQTPADVLDRLRGQQVHLAHGPGVESHYCHLEAVAPDLATGAQVEAGGLVGRVGASGTQEGIYRTGGGAHLHWEIWVDGRYLGQGLSLYETMRLWQAIFAP